jgi:GDSL-like Lipase/Acylhydrolase
VVPGVLPIGCFPLYLTLFQSSDASNYDQNGCLKNFNSLSSYHNSLLTQSISNLRGKYPGARIMYADFYNQVQQMVVSPQSFGQCYSTFFLVSVSVCFFLIKRLFLKFLPRNFISHDCLQPCFENNPIQILKISKILTFLQPFLFISCTY